MQTHESSSLELRLGRSEEDKQPSRPPSTATGSHWTDVGAGEWQEALSEDGHVYYWNSETGGFFDIFIMLSLGYVYSHDDETLMNILDFYDHLTWLFRSYDLW